jgi:DNA mismatch repair ATPase MutS
MKAHLMHRDRDFSAPAEFSEARRAMIEDLGLEGVFAAMADGDAFLLEVARRGVMASLTEVDEIEYRQAALRDCLAHPETIRRLFEIATSATQRPKKIWGSLGRSPGLVLSHAVRVLDALMEDLKDLRKLADECGAEFESEAFTTFFAMVTAELDDAYLEEIAGHLKRLQLRAGALISARLGDGLKGKDYVLRRPNEEPKGLARISAIFDRSGYTFHLAPRDEAGARALGDLHDQGINLVAEAAEQSANHVVNFFAALLAEVGFYIGALNLRGRLAEREEPICIPTAARPGEPVLSAEGLYDVGLALRSEAEMVGNPIDAAGRPLIVITGANQGGKSTFLRSLGLAQMMMQCGLFVAARSFAADVRDGLFTHFKREEDADMRSGKLDEELARMSEIAGELRPGGMVLFNESFAATDEQEGSEIARQVTCALLAAGIKVVHVTHMYELAHGFQENDSLDPLFLRAERTEDGTRTFHLIEGEPLSTSFGEDVYRKVFAGAST